MGEGGKVLDKIGEGIGTATNNVAEYRALLRGIEEAKRRAAKRLILRSDSQLLVRQLTGVYKVKESTLKRLVARALQELSVFSHWEIHHVPRELNREADRLANAAFLGE